MKNYIWMSDVIFSSLFNELDGRVNDRVNLKNLQNNRVLVEENCITAAF
ncbi:hypothetical protein [Sphingobacterium siyangense]